VKFHYQIPDYQVAHKQQLNLIALDSRNLIPDYRVANKQQLNSCS